MATQTETGTIEVVHEGTARDMELDALFTDTAPTAPYVWVGREREMAERVVSGRLFRGRRVVANRAGWEGMLASETLECPYSPADLDAAIARAAAALGGSPAAA